MTRRAAFRQRDVTRALKAARAADAAVAECLIQADGSIRLVLSDPTQHNPSSELAAWRDRQIARASQRN